MFVNSLKARLPILIPRSSITRTLSPSLLRLYSTLNTEPIYITPLKIINQIPNLNIKITDHAAERLNLIYNTSKEILQIGVESGGCHGFQYNLNLIPDPDLQSSKDSEKNTSKTQEEEDEFNTANSTKNDTVYVIPPDGGKVIIDEHSLKILNDSILNFTTELIGSQFKIEDGNLKSSCGCGSSFDAEVKK
ncbi:uncharacterized protein NDAI_0A07880 [Naumovozyma dairenensis CBS 421]|uniref:Core domain-containing protein n=1 Tax=Naumovozyma dairenensis (strain ATCC 10597 / BCRC 20456 / CBS 421 / NBRC 0211 / NRRL Y-12639) TaxID=1071378 RepID=G0W554_NAUDC|nr:hypothetical protein NDAI_0A07880 [Naumovozyma dairenensis CBS 421]CCD22942.1 hypothetical protein NDAI_0A07880 [Naumovozyma dairenensis CBS 421]